MNTQMTTAEKFCFYVITLCFAFFGYILVMSYKTGKTLPTEDSMILTAVVAIATGATGYIIGSSAGSKRKDDQLTGKDNLINKALDSVPIGAIENKQDTTTITKTASVSVTNPVEKEKEKDDTENV